jgi:hypothetical protein
MPVGGNQSLDSIIRLAANEAVEAACPQISTAHLLIALSRFCDVADPADTPARQGLLQEFASLGIEPKTFRRRYRAILGKGGGKSNNEGIEQSAQCRDVISAAEQIGSGSNTSVTPTILLRAVFASLSDNSCRTAQNVVVADDVPREL